MVESKAGKTVRNKKSHCCFEKQQKLHKLCNHINYAKITNMNLCEIRKDFLNSASFLKIQGKEFVYQ